VNTLTGVATYTPDVEFSGIDSFRYILKDDGGAVSNVAVVTITVVALPEQSARLQADPAEPGLTALIVKGSSHDDDIRVESEDHGKVKVTIGNKSLGVFAPTGRIIILGGDGNDEIEANGKFAVPVEIHGGAGNDDLRGPSSSAMLIGGSGNDVLIGGSGRDLLIGGTGTDRLFGKSADDLLIGGWTSFDDNAIALASIFSTWTRKDLTFSERVRRLHYGVTGGVQLNSTTVFDDGRNDLLSGGSGIDWTIESGEHCWTVQITKCLGANPSPERRG
jgi:Ca2+-binding RTX toxin-like protein